MSDVVCDGVSGVVVCVCKCCLGVLMTDGLTDICTS